ncbi:hypothetical protein [Vibrio alginolyticus]|uniref:hypothetical protein n=1 Tax=Vibrio alginolyticus TaxID=663 RepID=UPI00215D2935|nr:hypothetical protein [Vibrio alginolyticus]EJL6793309.1 hypothetical protein [Vibrio alginolyticus]EKP4437878.1 hypothetical protein [Vibrio alginolyticus]ELB2797657.1 hypothetical protein [Vibrio alginolyticus]MCR9597189.1 hypothetical protein [Vibrio alginolyticus]MCR9602476.1 hypothetical protein [Vibrio alginolyticus]
MSTQMAGGWSPFHELTAENKEVFAKGIEGFVGVKYSPLVVATQVVAGQNYAFFCNAEVVHPGAQPYPAMVHMFSDLEGKVGITHIERLNY